MPITEFIDDRPDPDNEIIATLLKRIQVLESQNQELIGINEELNKEIQDLYYND